MNDKDANEMSAAERTSGHLSQSGQNLGRILVASYFIAVALGLIGGTDLSVITHQLLPAPFADYAGNVIVFILAYLVLMGMWLRPAALLLALTMFWSSYIKNFGIGAEPVVGDFWRDLALIGALFLTYAQTGPRAAKRRAMVWWSPRVRRIEPAHHVMPRRVTATTPVRAKITPIAPRIAARDALIEAAREPIQEIENIFAEGFDEAVSN